MNNDNEMILLETMAIPMRQEAESLVKKVDNKRRIAHLFKVA